MKQGYVFLIGRPNTGKSTLVNNLLDKKVAITSPKPQTTRFPIQAVYQDDRGTLVFIDTPGLFNKAKDTLSKRINRQTLDSLKREIDVVVYLVDPTRKRDFEEAKVLGIVRKIDKPKILVFTKADKKAVYEAQYEFLKNEFDNVLYISALKKKHLKPLLDLLFKLIPEGREIELPENIIFPALNIDSKTFISELIREKIFLLTGDEVPYTTTVVTDKVEERKSKNLIYIKARILTTDNRYKKMLIGKEGRKIKEIGSYARKEIELSTGKKIYLDLIIETDPHWQERYF